MPLSICAPGSANWPENDITTPILTVCCACTGAAAIAAAATAVNPMYLRIGPSLGVFLLRSYVALTSLLLGHPRLDRILDVLDLVEDHVDQLAADLLDLADVDGLHHVAGHRIDRHRAARAV